MWFTKEERVTLPHLLVIPLFGLAWVLFGNIVFFIAMIFIVAFYGWLFTNFA